MVAHVAALLGLPQPLGDAAAGLHLGIFIVAVPAVLFAKRVAKGCQQATERKVLLRGCPPWMRALATVFFVYAFVNFTIFFAKAPPKGAARGLHPPAIVFRGFSGGWMAFYAVFAAMLYSAWVEERDNAARRCPNGHRVSQSALSCGECGAAIEQPRDGLSS